jgi:hypothetical protein
MPDQQKPFSELRIGNLYLTNLPAALSIGVMAGLMLVGAVVVIRAVL